MIKVNQIFLILILLTTIISAQVVDTLSSLGDNSFQVDSIEIRGNERTKEFIILKELTFSEGDTVNSEILFFNRERIFSLGIFTRVEVNNRIREKKNVVEIIIEESWHIFPVPFLFIREKTFKRTSYGISLKYKNFRGRNETIRAIVSLGYDPFYSLQYENLLIFPSADISFNFTGAFGTPVNKSPTLAIANGNSFDFRTIGITSIFGKRLNTSSSIFCSVGYSKIKAPNNNIDYYMASSTSTDEMFSLGISYIVDSRNLKQFANRGYLLSIDLLHYGIGNSRISYNVIGIDARNYRKLYKSIIIKGRFHARHTFGEYVPYYDYSLLGYNYYTRGNRYLVREGNNRLLGSIEMGYPILPEWNFGLDLPILPNSLTRSRISIVASVFLDVATTFNNNEKILLNDFNSGYGAGISFLFLPYNSFRIEYAFNEMGKGEFLIETGISF